MSSIAQALAGFTAKLEHDAVPREVRERAVHHMLDALGIGLASTTFEFAHRALSGVAAIAGGGPVKVIGTDARLPARDAAIVNGILCHGLDFDDTHQAAVLHPTVVALPAALSAAAHVGAGGREVVAAYLIGVEAAARLGVVARGGFRQVGFHPTCATCSPASRGDG